jgi:hypothetical protein
MSAIMKHVESLTVGDFIANPVWEFTNKDTDGETAMQPVAGLPVESLAGRLAGTEVTLANGSRMWGMLGNIDLRNRRATRHFLCLSINSAGHWVPLARYHDVDYARNGPTVFAGALGLKPADVFPISYDVSRYAVGDPASLANTIPELPDETLGEDKLIDLAMNG